MSRTSLTWPRRHRAVWDRPAADTRLLPIPFSNTVSPGPSVIPSGMSLKPSAPSRHPSPGVTRNVDARVYSRMPPRGSAPPGALLPAADACLDSPQMFPRPLPLRASPSAVDACPGSPQMYSHGPTPLRALPLAVDARAPARMILRPAVPGAMMDGCAFTQAIPHVPAPDAPAHAAEGALATTSSFSIPMPRERSLTPVRQFTSQGRVKRSRSPLGAGLVPALPDRRGVPHCHTKRK